MTKFNYVIYTLILLKDYNFSLININLKALNKLAIRGFYISVLNISLYKKMSFILLKIINIIQPLEKSHMSLYLSEFIHFSLSFLSNLSLFCFLHFLKFFYNQNILFRFLCNYFMINRTKLQLEEPITSIFLRCLTTSSLIKDSASTSRN